jgi:hypothetical protein
MPVEDWIKNCVIIFAVGFLAIVVPLGCSGEEAETKAPDSYASPPPEGLELNSSGGSRTVKGLTGD